MFAISCFIFLRIVMIFFFKAFFSCKNPCFLQIAVLFFHLGPPPSAFRPIFQVRAFPLMSDDLCRSPHIRAWDTKCRLETEGLSGAWQLWASRQGGVAGSFSWDVPVSLIRFHLERSSSLLPQGLDFWRLSRGEGWGFHHPKYTYLFVFLVSQHSVVPRVPQSRDSLLCPPK